MKLAPERVFSCKAPPKKPSRSKFHVNKVSGQMFQPLPCERNLKHQSDLKSTTSIILSNANRCCLVTQLENYSDVFHDKPLIYRANWRPLRK